MVYSAPPPRYAPIRTANGSDTFILYLFISLIYLCLCAETMNLFTYVDMLKNANSPQFGLVLGDCDDLRDWVDEQQQPDPNAPEK